MSTQQDDELEVPQQEAGALFRLEMWATNIFLGYWQHMVAVIAAVLLAILVYGQYSSYYRQSQRDTTARIARVLEDMPEVAPGLPLQAEQREELVAIGDALVAVAQEAEGTASIEAYLRAAESFREADNVEKQREALDAAALVSGSKGPLRYAALAGLANLELELGESDQAVARLRSLVEEEKGFEGQQAAMDLGLVLEHLDRKDEALQVYQSFLNKWPDSSRTSEVETRLSKVSSTSSAPPEPASEPAPAPEEVPTEPAPQEGPTEPVPGDVETVEGPEAPE